LNQKILNLQKYIQLKAFGREYACANIKVLAKTEKKYSLKD
jgi:hypothetical protein